MCPAIHAFLVGVSAYPHLPGGTGEPAVHSFGIGQLTAAARSAASVRDWLESSHTRLPLPLGHVRTLLSSSPGERGAVGSSDGPATLAAFRRAAVAWRDDCSTDPANIAFCYVAGHGVQRTRTDAVLLLEDFLETGGNPLFHAVDTTNLFNGMAPTSDRPGMARNQLWLFDTCRVFPAAFDRFEALRASEVFEVGLSDYDDRCAPVFFGSVPGGAAYAVPGTTTIFSRALLRCLDGAASQQRPGEMGTWEVTVGSLVNALPSVITQVNAEVGGRQVSFVGGQTTQPGRRIVTAPGVPDVAVTLELRPRGAARGVSLQVTGADGSALSVPTPLDPNPYRDTWAAGVYRMAAAPPTCGVPRQDLIVLPPEYAWVGQVAS